MDANITSAIISGMFGAAGAYASIWAHLGFIKWRLNEQKDLLLKHDDKIGCHEKEITNLKMKLGN